MAALEAVQQSLPVTRSPGPAFPQPAVKRGRGIQAKETKSVEGCLTPQTALFCVPLSTPPPRFCTDAKKMKTRPPPHYPDHTFNVVGPGPCSPPRGGEGRLSSRAHTHTGGVFQIKSGPHHRAVASCPSPSSHALMFPCGLYYSPGFTSRVVHFSKGEVRNLIGRQKEKASGNIWPCLAVFWLFFLAILATFGNSAIFFTPKNEIMPHNSSHV